MLRSLKDLEKFGVGATDGPIGQVKDLYFDDDTWAVRYFVVATGSWLSGRKVLISPIAVHHPDWEAKTLPVSLSKDQIRNSPDIDTDKPVSRQNEVQYLGYYGYNEYWGAAGLWGPGLYPYAMAPGFAGFGADREERNRELEAFVREDRARHRNDDPHLRSCNAVTGYRIQATDGEIGRVVDFLVDDQTWALRHLVVETGSWWLGKKVLVSPTWIDRVHWATETVSVSVTREAIRGAKPFDPNLEWDLEQEVELYRHHGRTTYQTHQSR